MKYYTVLKFYTVCSSQIHIRFMRLHCLKNPERQGKRCLIDDFHPLMTKQLNALTLWRSVAVFVAKIPAGFIATETTIDRAKLNPPFL